MNKNAKKDKDLGLGVGRGNKMFHTREMFKAWLMLPRNFLGAGEGTLQALGIEDDEFRVLYGIRSQSEFAREFGIAEPTLSRWKREIGTDPDIAEFKKYMHRMTNNVIGALYRKILSDADAPRVKLWLEYVEGWSQRFATEALKSPYNLSDSEKAELDALIARNCT